MPPLHKNIKIVHFWPLSPNFPLWAPKFVKLAFLFPLTSGLRPSFRKYQEKHWLYDQIWSDFTKETQALWSDMTKFYKREDKKTFKILNKAETFNMHRLS